MMFKSKKQSAIWLTVLSTLYNMSAHAAFFYDADSSNTTVNIVGLSASRLGNGILSNPSSLTAGQYNYNYAVVLFKPQESGTYVFGQTYAPIDTVMILYKNVYNPLLPGVDALAGNDDTSQSTHQSIVGSGITTFCGSVNYCPQISVQVEAGRIYSLFVSVYNPGNVISIPFQFYSSNPGSFGSIDDIGPIDLRKEFYASSTLSFTTYPIFRGGTLKIDVSNHTYTEDFTLADIPSNSIDQSGNHVVFAGTFSDEIIGLPGSIMIKNSGNGGSVAFSAVNTYTGPTTILSGGMLRLEGSGNIALSEQVSLEGIGATFDIGAISAPETKINNLSGTLGSMINLHGKTLAVDNQKDTVYMGDFDISNGSLRKSGPGNLTLSGNTNYTGDTFLDAGSLTLDGQYNGAKLTSNIMGQPTTQLSLINGARLTGGIQQSNVMIGAHSVWNVTQNSTIGQLGHTGTISFTPPANGGYKTLHIQGNYHGNNGLVVLNTQLGGDQSATDKVVIYGNALGHTFLRINNAQGMGDQTMQGINLIEVKGESDQFRLGHTVMAGSYEYILKSKIEGGEIVWYLSSRVYDPNGGNGGEGSSIDRPDIGANIGNLQSVMEHMVPGFVMASGTSAIGGPGAIRLDNRLQKKNSSVWGYVTTSKTTGRAAGNQISYDTKLYALDIGGDHIFFIGDSALNIGAMVHSSTAKTHSRNRLTTSWARGDAEGYGAGVYATWFIKNNGTLSPFLDVFITYGHYNNKVYSRGNAESRYNANAWSITLQGGYPIALTSHIILEPQAQITLLDYNAKDYVNPDRTHVSQKFKGNMVGRIGTYIYGRGYKVKPYGAFNLWHDNTQVNMRYNQGRMVTSDKRGTFIEAKVGVEAQATSNLSFWAEAGARAGQHQYRDYKASLGFKYMW